MKTEFVLCTTDWLEYKAYFKGNEYVIEYVKEVDSYKIYNENSESSWFNCDEINRWFLRY